jgi:hypothetical protein
MKSETALLGDGFCQLSSLHVSVSPQLLGRCCRQLSKGSVGTTIVYLRVECVFILDCHFASKSSAAVCEAFSNSYLDMEVPNKTKTMMSLVLSMLL